MAWVILSKYDTFKKRAESLPKEVYALYYNSTSLILRPEVTTRGRDSHVIRNLPNEKVEEFKKWWGEESSFEVDDIQFDEASWRSIKRE